MDIKEQLAILSEICKHDLELIENRKSIARLGHESSDAKSSANTLAESISSFKNRKEEILKRRRDLDEKLQLEKANLRKWEARAEKIKGEREYTALMSEISGQKRTILGVETDIKSANDELTALEQKVVKATGAHDEKIDKASTAYEQVKELLGQEEEKRSLNESSKNALMNKLPKSLVKKYVQIHTNRSEQGIAFLRNEVCLACRRTVPAEFYIRTCREETIEQCPYCLRILVANIDENPR